LVHWLHRLGAIVTGIGLAPSTEPSLFQLAGVEDFCDSHVLDIRDGDLVDELIEHVRPEIVFHLAAQPLVRASYRDPLETFSTNVMGTAHVLDALRRLEEIRVAVMVTTDKVYRAGTSARPCREDDALGGHDPYSASKAASEMVIASYRGAFLRERGVAVASARAGNVIGGGDWAQDRLLPDAVRAWQEEKALEVRRPNSVRPWQHVLEPLAGYLALAEKLWEQPALAGAFNFGPGTDRTATVREVIEIARSSYGSGAVRFAEKQEGPHETHRLVLDTEKAARVLGSVSLWDLKQSIEKTMSWYRKQHEGERARSLCEAQIAEYEGLL